MKNILLGTVLLVCCVSLNAQFLDDFDDASFPNTPDWFGNTNIYVVNAANELQLMDVAAGESLIYAPVATQDSTTWEFYFRLDFEPSTTNNLKVYLNADSPDFDGNLQGYYLQIGLSGGLDSIELRRQDGSGSNFERILSGVAGGVAVDPGVRVRVTRDQNANWFLYTDYSGGTNFQLDGMAQDATYNGGNYFGFKCLYGVTRRDKFFFDDISIGPLVEDETAPALIGAIAQDANTLVLQFDEPLDQSSAEIPANYSINNGITVNTATLNADPSTVTLGVSNLTSGSNYLVTVQNISDINTNVLTEGEAGFDFFITEPASPFDILINELFPKPDPGVTSLPDAEFIELFNRSDKAIDLEGFEVFDASNVKTLPTYVFPPQSYLILCNSTEVGNFTSFGNVLGISGLFLLNDDGDDAGLRDNNGVEIHKISFTASTYQDDDKNDGGWTLELINPNLFCLGESNLRASVNNSGGTPGQVNSLFDDTPDITPPMVLDVIAISENQLRVFYDEPMGVSSEEISSYAISTTGSVIDAQIEADQQTVLLTIAAPFFADQSNYTIAISNQVTDCTGNNINEATFDFTFLQTEPADRYDVLINEFYPDFLPTFGLPEKEFVELYNRSDKTINLENFIINNGTENVTLPFFLLQAGAYVTLYESGGPGFGALGDTIAVPNFIGLANEGDEFKLLAPNGEVIHSVDYGLSWYQDFDKLEGGWSIELINPDAPCTFKTNWRASVNPSGGTPGRVNSVLNIEPDDTPLDLIRAFPISSNEVQLFFNKALDENTVGDLDNYSVEGLTIEAATLVAPFNLVLIRFSEMMASDQIYEMFLKTSLTDCIGNGVGVMDNARFALPQPIEVKDILINEVLFDPEVGGIRFVELYNRSNKVFNLGDLHLADRDVNGEEIDNNFEVTTDFLFFPGAYLVLTSFPQNILDFYTVENPDWLIQNVVPAYNDKEDAVLIFVPEVLGPKIIDELKYTKDFHNALLDTEEGVSLERINFEAETQDPTTWQSAAETAGFATPTYLNSQFFENTSGSENIFDIPNTTFSPDGDGFEDFLLINYTSSEGGWVANIQLFDANGRLVKRLVQNQTLASNGSFKWEGDTDDGTKARIGIYIVWIEIFKSNGDVEQIKKTCVVGGQLD